MYVSCVVGVVLLVGVVVSEVVFVSICCLVVSCLALSGLELNVKLCFVLCA